MRSFQAKLLYLLVSVLVLLLAVTLIAVHVFGQQTMRNSVTEELRVGVRILERILEGRSRQLADKATVIAADFAFRDTVASADRATIASALANHSERIDADAAFVISLDGLVVADTLEGRYAGRPFPLPSLLREAEARGESAATVALDDRPHQLVVVPMLAPRRIAWVCMGFAIDERVLDDVAAVTELDVSLWNASARRPELLSTLPQKARGELLERRSAFDRGKRDADEELEIGSTRYQAIVHPIRTADGSRIQTLLQRSIEEAARPYLLLELEIFVLSSLALLAALAVATLFARGVSRPLETLAEGAQRIERGDYATPVDVRQNDEIGRLATAFNEMRTGIAEREEQIRYQATHDSLTGLPNRTLFLDRLEQAILKARRTGEIVGMIMMDLDRFKDINDTLGHPFGDQLLIEIGRRLTQTLRESDTVARLGGDEFAVTFYVRYGRRAVDVAQRISTALETPFALAGVSVDVDASMGIALYPLHANDAETLMKRADIAMYEAKRDHSAFATYEPGRDEHSLRRLAILSDLRHSIARDELVLHYQPKIDFRLEKVAHAEALVRWRHPVHGLLSPDEFVPLAEQSGNIGAITKWVLRRAITDCGEWNAAGLDLTVAVNLSVLDLFDAELPTYIGGLLSEVGLPPSKLVLEITESAVMKDPAYALRILRDLKTRGVTLAIDDYGTGYSSLAHLKRLPVDELKIDKSFVLNLQASATDDLVIVRSTIELGHNMGLRVIAEGVESEEAWGILRDLGCDMGQGYYVSRPLAVEAFRTWVAESKWGLGDGLIGPIGQ